MIGVIPTILPRVAPRIDPYVLLVDDNVTTLRQLADVIQGSGYPCVSAPSGTEALLCCDVRRPRVIVTDFAMPNLDGLALARWLRTRHPSVPMILLSGESFDDRSLAALRHSFTAVLTKPVDIELLLGLIDRVMPGPRNQRRAEGRT